MDMEEYFKKTSEIIENTSKEEFLETLKEVLIENCELKNENESVKTKEYLTKENKMLKECINIVVGAYMHENSIDEVFHQTTSKMGEFYNHKPPKRKN